MIITSLLDTDLYKFSMMQVVLHHFPAAQVEYKYKCRTRDIYLYPYIDEMKDEIHQLCQLRFTDTELEFLNSLRFIKSDFIDFLRLFYLPERCIHIDGNKNLNEISITINGPWLHTILFEVPVLSILNEIYFRNVFSYPDWEQGRERLKSKINLVLSNLDLKDFKIAEYGTRRRFSKIWHEEIVSTLKNEMGKHFIGTSNVLLAKKNNISPLGTMGHEYLQACQALGPRLQDSQVFALETWAKEYRGDLGIAISDVYGIEAFLNDFDMYFCKLFDGARHDSGDPFVWGERILKHYENNRVDARNKTLVFSDSLTLPRAIELYYHFVGRCRLSFGIGTNLTNDLGYKPLQTVIKMVRCNNQPVAKVSDEPGKTMCDDTGYLSYLRKVFQLPIM